LFKINTLSAIGISVVVIVVLISSDASAQFVPFDDPTLSVETDAGITTLSETYLRVAIADPGKPVNGVYINTNANNSLLNLRAGETVHVSGLDSAYFNGNFLNVSLVNTSIVRIPPDSKFLHIEFLGKAEPLYNTNDLEKYRINFTIPTSIARGNYSFMIVTGEEELHYYSTNARVM
jgi:hypothetical protein